MDRQSRKKLGNAYKKIGKKQLRFSDRAKIFNRTSDFDNQPHHETTTIATLELHPIPRTHPNYEAADVCKLTSSCMLFRNQLQTIGLHVQSKFTFASLALNINNVLSFFLTLSVQKKKEPVQNLAKTFVKPIMVSIRFFSNNSKYHTKSFWKYLFQISSFGI